MWYWSDIGILAAACQAVSTGRIRWWQLNHHINIVPTFLELASHHCSGYISLLLGYNINELATYKFTITKLQY